MKKSPLIQKYEKILEGYGFDCEYHKKTDELPFDYLQISIGPDDQGRERHIILRLIEAPEEEEQADKAYFIALTQLSVILPFEIKKGCMGETARILMFYNQSLDSPGFCMDEGTKRPYFRYSFPTTPEGISNESFIGIIAMIMFNIETYSDTIEEVANGKSMKDTINDALRELGTTT